MAFDEFLKSDSVYIMGSPHSCTASWLKAHGFNAVILDWDGVITYMDGTVLSIEIKQWLESLLNSGIHVAIYSNQSELLYHKRSQHLEAIGLEAIEMIPPIFRKPDPAGILRIESKWKKLKKEILMLDDRIWTGGLAAYRAGVQFAYCSRPLKQYTESFVREVFFDMVRKIERGWHWF